MSYSELFKMYGSMLGGTLWWLDKTPVTFTMSFHQLYKFWTIASMQIRWPNNPCSFNNKCGGYTWSSNLHTPLTFTGYRTRDFRSLDYQTIHQKRGLGWRWLWPWPLSWSQSETISPWLVSHHDHTDISNILYVMSMSMIKKKFGMIACRSPRTQLDLSMIKVTALVHDREHNMTLKTVIYRDKNK